MCVVRLVLSAAAAALAIGALAPADPPAPRITLVDHTAVDNISLNNGVALDPPPFDPGDGSLPNGGVLIPFDVADPAIGRLDPALLSAVQNAATAAATDGITMTVTSGWRSPEFQQRLLDDAVQTYGSFAAARQYVQTPEMSKHVIGQAVDVGGVGADQWLIENGARFGLCRIYANELWHFELAAGALGNCPALLPNAG